MPCPVILGLRKASILCQLNTDHFCMSRKGRGTSMLKHRVFTLTQYTKCAAAHRPGRVFCACTHTRMAQTHGTHRLTKHTDSRNKIRKGGKAVGIVLKRRKGSRLPFQHMKCAATHGRSAAGCLVRRPQPPAADSGKDPQATAQWEGLSEAKGLRMRCLGTKAARQTRLSTWAGNGKI